MELDSIQKIFNKPFNLAEWKGVLKNLFTNFDEYRTSIDRLEVNLSYHENAKKINEFGSILLADNKVIKLYDVLLKGDYDIAKSRVGLRNMIFRDIVPGDMDGILAIFRSESGKTWRLTFISKSIYWDDDFNEQKLQTSPRRYTYVLGENESVKTAAKQFESLFNKKVTIKQLIEAFNVDKLNKRFFSDYQKHYEKFVLELTGEIWKKKQNKYILTKVQEPSPLLNTAFYNNKKNARDFCKKLLGRIVFLHFLQKKGWMGCSVNDQHWENGEKQFLLELFNGYEDKERFHSKCLTELFFNTLNKPDRNDIFKVEGLNNDLNGSRVPYLNGGLFESDTNCDPYKVDFPPVFFEELLDFFGQYNFTIDENSPDDHEVGIDPEMLGHIFENLLEENKEKGAFYTPKEIVQYMTQESLIQYLQTHLGEHKELANFIRNNDIGDRTAKSNYIRDNAAKIEELLDSVKICDPAIGSGAFPMGMLNEIFEAKMTLDMTLNRSEVKKKIIQNSIYGVDLESGAVDIARLRFWLALVVDEDMPQALPNLDYKIMQGNSLLESFEGIDLSEIHKGKAITIDDSKNGDNLFSKVMDVQEVYNEEKLEDLIKTYFDLDDPVVKKSQHDKIDKQILGKIYKCLLNEHEELEIELKKLNKKIKNNSSSLSTADQKIKYESTSKDAKNAKKLRNQIDSIAEKQLKLKELYESNDRPFFLWHLMFKDVFDKRGFDIVIGNPPYVSAVTMKRSNAVKEIFKTTYPTVKGSYDIYILFLLLGINLLNENGVYSWIIPNKFLISDYAKTTKTKLIENGLYQSINVSSFNIFKGVGVYPIILLGNKSKNQDNFEEYYLKKYSDIKTNKLTPIEKLPVFPIIDDFKFKINAGATGFQAQSLKKHIVKTKKANSIPFTVSGNVDRFEYNNRNVKFMKGKFEEAFVESNDEVADSKWRFWNSPKIVIAGMTKEVEAVYVKEPLALGVGIYGIYEWGNFEPYSLTCILNSSFMTYYFKNKFKDKHLAGGYLAINKSTILNFPMLKPSATIEGVLEIISKYLHWLKECEEINKDKKSVYSVMLEEVVDAIVFELFFPNHFAKANISISIPASVLFNNQIALPNYESLSIIFETFSEKKNSLRNQIKLMKIELKSLLNPILST